MALLLAADRLEVWAEAMRTNREPIGISKVDLRAAVDAIDQWIEDNTVSFNTAIPLPARTSLTAKQKVLLFVTVLRRRFEVT
jgi:hypothetical protein